MTVGSRVESTQLVGRTNLPSGFRIVPVARLLDVSTSEVETYLQVKLGDMVHRGDVIARRGGLLGRSVKSPVDGVVTARGGGRVLIEAQPTPFELHAYIPGTVLHVKDNQRVVIETSGALIQGTWGLGGESVGVIKDVARRTDGPLRARAIDASCHGAILVAGVTRDREALERAEDVEARGIVTGGLCSDLMSFAEQLSFPLIVTEGIGDVAMIRKIFRLLKENEGEEASVSGRVTSRWDGQRPEIIIPKPDTRAPEKEAERGGGITVGTQVRVVRAPHMGTVGTVVGLPWYARRIETGARARCADVDIGQDEPVSIPLVNLDVVG
ncbi:MAG: hypothetical protein PVI07_19175 [Anaerolineae bacterium]